MKKYFILFLSVLLLVVCGCKQNVEPKPAFTVYSEAEGLRVEIESPSKYKVATVKVYDITEKRYNLSADVTDLSQNLVYPFVKDGKKYEVLVYLYELNGEKWTNKYYVGWADIYAEGGIGDYSISCSGISYDGTNTISLTDYQIVKPEGFTTDYAFGYIYATSDDYTWGNNYVCDETSTFSSWEKTDNDVINLNKETGVCTFNETKNSYILEYLNGKENKKNFWLYYVSRANYKNISYEWVYDTGIINTYGTACTTYSTEDGFLKVKSTSDGFTLIKNENSYYPNVRISVYNVTKEYECPRVSTGWAYREIDYDYLNSGDKYDVKLEIWDENWGSYYTRTIKGIQALGGKGDLGFKYNSAEYKQGTEETEYVADIVLTGAEFIGDRMPEKFTMNGSLWYSSNNQNYNAYYDNFESKYDSTKKNLTINVSPLISTIRGKNFYPELAYEWEYNGTKYQLTIIDDKTAVMEDTHVKPESCELNNEFNFIPEDGTYTVADELQGKKAYLIKYNKNSSKVNDSCIIKNASTLEESLSKARCAAEDAIANGVVPDTIRRWEVDFVGYDFGEPIGPKNVSRNAAPLANYDDYVVDETSDNFLIKNVKDNKFYKYEATLKAIGEHCNVWYVNNNQLAHEVLYKAITDKKTGFQTVADKFDTFFEYETYLAGSNVPTKDYLDIIDIDDSVKIDILICDIDEQYKDGMNGGVYGYFWPKDMTLQTQIASSNERQMIYIDSAFLGIDPVYMYATLSHEFQHLLLYVNKWLNKKLDFPTWYTEMMSLGMEDVLQIACLEYKNNEAISGRVYSFNGGYNAGFVDWGKMNGSVYYSYANAAIFMDYLLKNYGGVDLYYEIAHNNYVGQESITKALQKLGYNETFDTVMMKMGQVIVNSFAATLPADAITVNKKASSTLNINGKDVVFKFNELDLKNYSHDNSTKNYNTADRYLNYSFDYKGSDGKPYYYGGPSVLLPNKNFTNIYSNAITVNLISETPSKIKLNNPGNNIEMAVYLCDVYNK